MEKNKELQNTNIKNVEEKNSLTQISYLDDIETQDAFFKNFIDNKSIISIKTFKEISMNHFKSGKYKKLGLARESYAKKLGYDCYRSYTHAYYNYWNELSQEVFKIINNHKAMHTPKPILLVIDADLDYIKLIKEEYKNDFKYFNQFPKKQLFAQGRKFSEINIYDVLTTFEYEKNCSIEIKGNSNIIFLDKNGRNINLEQFLERLREILPNKIFNVIKILMDNINSVNKQKDEDTLSMLFTAIQSICLQALVVINEDELLNLLNDDKNGLPKKEYFESNAFKFKELYERISIVCQHVLKEVINKSDNGLYIIEGTTNSGMTTTINLNVPNNLFIKEE